MHAVMVLQDESILDGFRHQVSFRSCKKLAIMITPTNPGVCSGELGHRSLKGSNLLSPHFKGGMNREEEDDITDGPSEFTTAFDVNSV